MSENNLNEKRSGNKLATYAVVTLLAGAAGFLAIYVTFGSHYNEEPKIARQIAQQTAAKSLKKLECPRPSRSGLSELHRFNCGDMVAFVITKKRPLLKNIKFQNAEGEVTSLKKWRGKYVLLNVWATWCSPCRKEMPDLDKLKFEFRDHNFDVVAISIDRGGLAKPKRFLEKAGIKNLKLYVDPKSKLIGPLRIIGMPTTFLIDPKGRQIGRLTGPAHWASDDAKRLILAAMNKAG